MGLGLVPNERYGWAIASSTAIRSKLMQYELPILGVGEIKEGSTFTNVIALLDLGSGNQCDVCQSKGIFISRCKDRFKDFASLAL